MFRHAKLPWARLLQKAQKDHRAAYISYFAVLNFLRARSVFQEARHRKFLAKNKTVVDWGAGSGAALLAFLSEPGRVGTAHHKGGSIQVLASR